MRRLPRTLRGSHYHATGKTRGEKTRGGITACGRVPQKAGSEQIALGRGHGSPLSRGPGTMVTSSPESPVAEDKCACMRPEKHRGRPLLRRRGYNSADHGEEHMPAKQLRCEESVSSGYDPTQENAQECRAPALACADCGESAGCAEHAQLCSKCGEPVCAYCEDEHACMPGRKPRAA